MENGRRLNFRKRAVDLETAGEAAAPVLAPSACKPEAPFPKRPKGKTKVEHRGYQGTWNGANTVFNADVTPGECIRVFGTYQGNLFDRVFKIGDEVEHHSYNLRYTGPILAIAANTVSVKDNERVKRMKLDAFTWRNWNMDLEKLHRENSETMMCI